MTKCNINTVCRYEISFFDHYLFLNTYLVCFPLVNTKKLFMNTKNSKIAILQFEVTSDKNSNILKAREYIQHAVNDYNASLIILPECWNSPYDTSAFPEYAEVLPNVKDEVYDLGNSPSALILFECAKEFGIYIIGGSIPEVVDSVKEEEKDINSYYNTCLCIAPNGSLVGKHRKIHLFDVNIENGIKFRESETLNCGSTPTAFYAGEKFGTIGIGICYDMRFPEYANMLRYSYNCDVLIYPGAFNMTTGPLHWELLQRGRAVDNQTFVITASPARIKKLYNDKYKPYFAWGHSSVVSPWGEVIATTEHDEDIVVCDLGDVKQIIQKIRTEIPVSIQRRTDIYLSKLQI